MIKQEVERAGLTNIGFSIGLRRLIAKRFVEVVNDQDYNGNEFQTLIVTEHGWTWIERNETKFVISRPKKRSGTFDEMNVDIPF